MTGINYQRANFFRIYFNNSSLCAVLYDSIDVENAVFAQWQSRTDTKLHYARFKPSGKDKSTALEVDLVSTSPNQKVLFAVEVKWSDRIVSQPQDLKGLFELMDKNNLQNALVTTKTITEAQRIGNKPISFYPAAVYSYTVADNVSYDLF